MEGTSNTTTYIAAQVFTDAADLIEAQGWTQGGFYPGWNETLVALNRYEAAELINERGLPCCVVGALTACGGDDTSIAALARHLVGDALAVSNKTEEVVVAWNDNPRTTADQVTTALRATAAEAHA